MSGLSQAHWKDESSGLKVPRNWPSACHCEPSSNRTVTVPVSASKSHSEHDVSLHSPCVSASCLASYSAQAAASSASASGDSGASSCVSSFSFFLKNIASNPLPDSSGV